MRELLDVVHELAAPEPGRRQPLVRELTGAAVDAEWKEILAGFDPDRPLSYDALLAGVRASGGERGFSRKEALILLLGNLKHGGL